MKQYKYNGKTSIYTTIDINGEWIDISLHDGEIYNLPENSRFILGLVSQGLLTLIKKK